MLFWHTAEVLLTHLILQHPSKKRLLFSPLLAQMKKPRGAATCLVEAVPELKAGNLTQELSAVKYQDQNLATTRCLHSFTVCSFTVGHLGRPQFILKISMSHLKAKAKIVFNTSLCSSQH